MSSIQPAQHKSPLVPSLFKTIRSGYSLGMLSKDVSAGITVGVVALPLALAFAIASGLTPERGLYTSIIAGFFMAFFSGSRFPVSGPTGAFVVIIYSIVSRHGYEGLVLTTLMAGILLVIFGFLRLGALVKYIPYPVTTGFTTGIALLIFSSQMKDFFGLPLVDTPPEFFDKWGAYAQNAMDFSPSTFGVAAFTLLVILIVRRKIPKLPAPVVAVFLSTLLVWLFSLPTDTIGSRFGTLPTGFPDFALPQGVTFERIRELFPDALTIALLAGIESLLAWCNDHDIEVVLIVPPYAPSVYERMVESGNYGYFDWIMPILTELCAPYGYEVYDFSYMPDTLDEEYIDGYHGSDRVYARLALHLAEESETLAGLIDTDYLNAALAPSSSPLRLAE